MDCLQRACRDRVAGRSALRRAHWSPTQGRTVRSKYDYRRTFCEVCGMPGSYLSSEAWWTCSEHFRAEKPERRLFDHVTGEPRPAREPAPADPLHERIETHGGFSISGPDALRLIAKEDP